MPHPREWRCLECRAILGERCGRWLKLSIIASEAEIRERDVIVECRSCGATKVWQIKERMRAV